MKAKLKRMLMLGRGERSNPDQDALRERLQVLADKVEKEFKEVSKELNYPHQVETFSRLQNLHERKGTKVLLNEGIG